MKKDKSFLLRISIKIDDILFSAGSVVSVVDSKTLIVKNPYKLSGKKIILEDKQINYILVENTTLNRNILKTVLKEIKKQNEIIDKIKNRWLKLPLVNFDSK